MLEEKENQMKQVFNTVALSSQRSSSDTRASEGPFTPMNRAKVGIEASLQLHCLDDPSRCAIPDPGDSKCICVAVINNSTSTCYSLRIAHTLHYALQMAYFGKS